MTTNDDPQSFAEILKPQSEADFIAHWEEEFKRDPEHTRQLGICSFCGADLGEKVIKCEKEGRTIPFFLPNVCCQSCCEKETEAFKTRQEAEHNQVFVGTIPTEFLSWDQSKGNNAALAAARGRFSISARRGVILHGSSGTCKTRIMWELVKQVASDREGFSWHVLDSFEASTQGIPREAFLCDFLFIDDLGNEPKSAKFETGLLHLLRKRFDWHKPTTITTQLTGQAFKERFFDGHAADAILRRLRQACANIPTDAPRPHSEPAATHD